MGDENYTKKVRGKMSIILASTLALLAAAGTVEPMADFEIEPVQYSTMISNSMPSATKDRPSGPMIIGGGTLEILLDGNDLSPELLSKFSEDDYYGQYELGFDANGAVTTCTKLSYGGPGLIDTHICRSFGKAAQFKFAPKYLMDAPVGYLSIYFNWGRRKHIAEPVVFTKKDKGIPINMTYTKATNTKAADCKNYDNDITDSEKSQICLAIQHSKRFKAQLLSLKKPKVSYGNANQFYVNGWIKPKSPNPPAESTLKWEMDQYHQSPAAYTYPNAIPANAKRITASMGKFFMELKNSDRPDLKESQWQRYNGDATIAVAINPDGSVHSCKPYISSQAAGLDIKACQVAAERGRFVFTAGKPTDTELRYIAVPVAWPEAPSN
jgi:hypothetical protein